MAFHEDEGSEFEDFSFKHMQRFLADMKYQNSYFDLYNSFAKYMSSVIGYITEDDALRLISGRLSAGLPDKDLYDSDVTVAREQMQLGLIRVIMPLLEDTGTPPDQYKTWLNEAVPVALDTHNSRHGVEECLGSNSPIFMTLDCDNASNCPVKVVRHKLLEDIAQPPFENGKYAGPHGEESWMRERKIRALLKLSVCKDNYLIQPTHAAVLKSDYMTQYRNNAKYSPGKQDN
jgi:hypothetical protein